MNFAPSLNTLRHLMELRRGEAITKLQDLGGVNYLCQTLRTSPTDGVNVQLISLYFCVFLMR